jgi:hypothetical protein
MAQERIPHQGVDGVLLRAARLSEEAQKLIIHSRNLRQRLILEEALARLEAGKVEPARKRPLLLDAGSI